MALSTPYAGVEPPYKGNVTETQDDLNAWIERVHRAGIQMNCHANGDVAIDMVLTAVERAQKLFPRADARPKITHCTLINDDLMRRMKATGVVPAAVHDLRVLQHRQVPVLRRRPDEAIAWRSASFLDAGIPAAAGSDFSPGPFAPLMGMQGMVTRTGWDGKTWGANQRITRRRGAADQHAERRLCLARRGDQGLDHAGQARRLRGARRRSAHRGRDKIKDITDRPDRRRRIDRLPGLTAPLRIGGS